MKIYHVETQQAYDELMIKLEEKGCEWRCVEKPTKLDKFKIYGKDTYIYEEYGIISLSDGYYSKVYRSNETLIEYKAKGESMTQEEMKHKLQEVAKLHEVAFDISASIGSFARGTLAVEKDLQEAKSSAKKLIEKIDKYLESLKPEFKVGDIVSSEIFINGSGIIRLEEDLINDFSRIKGLWYIKKDCEIKDTSFGVINKKTRHATQEEISEYESALQFHKHGRNPFEVKEGDLLENKFGRYIANGYSFSKEDFMVGSNTLLKTAEEVNEWL